jgi:hypothetical protein
VDQTADESTETTALDGLMAEELWRLVDELPARRRLLMRALAASGGDSYRDVAHTTGLPIRKHWPYPRPRRQPAAGSHGGTRAPACDWTF